MHSALHPLGPSAFPHGRVLNVFVLMWGLLLTGCASQIYQNTPAGRFKGSLDIRWVDNDYFIFIPNPQQPFRFIRSNGVEIRPDVMYTDGGSIPRFLWGVEGLSPFGYAPAHIIHDWLFEAQHCRYSPDDQYSFQDSVDLMAESLKTLMEEPGTRHSSFIFDAVVAAVASPIAKRLWSEGECNAPGRDIQKLRGDALNDPGTFIMTISYD